METARADHFAAVLNAWRNLADGDQAFVISTAAARAAMTKQRRRTGVGVYTLFKGAPDLPAGLDFRQIKNFYNGRLKRLRREHWDYMMAKWACLPDRPDLVRLTPSVVESLREHVRRTGKGPQAMLRGVHSRPQGLTSTIAANWLRGKSTMAQKDHLQFILTLYDSAPSQRQGVHSS